MAISYTNKLSCVVVESSLSLKLLMKKVEKRMLPSFLKGVTSQVCRGLSDLLPSLQH